jgi:hypothetical protein
MRVEGHSVVKFENFLYIFGGFDLDVKKETNALYRLDVADIERGLTHSSDVIASRTSNAAAAGGGDMLGVLAGSGPEGGKASLAASRAYMYNMTPATMQQPAAADPSAATPPPFWKNQSTAVSEDVLMYPVSTTGVPPPPRAHHACCMRGPYMVVWGGSQSTTDDESLLGGDASSSPNSSSSLGVTELFALNLESLVWSTYVVASVAPHVKQQFVPQQRCHATMVCAEDALLLYGGYPTTIQRGEEALGFAPNEWRVFRVSGDGLCDAQEPAGASPALWGHSVVYAHRCILAFGGIDAHSNEEVNSLCVYHLDERKWRWAEFPEGPCSRALHSAVFDTAQAAMIVYGGFSSSAGDDDRFVGDDPSPTRGGAAADGSNPIVSQLQDVWSFSLDTGLWEKLFPSAIGSASRTGTGSSSSWAPPGRSGHASVYHNHRMFVIGGLVEKSDGVGVGSPKGMSGSSMGFLQNSTNGSSRTASSGDGGLLIFDLHSRRWRSKNIIIAKASVTSSSSAPASSSGATAGNQHSVISVDSSADGTELTRRESIIDKYLNVAAISPNGSTNHMTTPSRSTLRGAGGASGPRTVGDARAAYAQDAPSPLVVKANPLGSAASLQQALVASVFHEAAAEQRRRQLLTNGGDSDRRSSSPSRWADDNAAANRRSSSRGTDDYADALLGNATTTTTNRSPLSMQRSLTNEVLQSYRTPPRFSGRMNTTADGSGGRGVVSSPLLMPTTSLPPAAAAVPFTRMHQMVSSIAEQQSAADLRWTAAENERRSKLLMQYLSTHGDPSTSPWASMTSPTGLQDDETDVVGGRLQSAARPHDPRMIIASASVQPPFGNSSRRSSVSQQPHDHHVGSPSGTSLERKLPQRSTSSELPLDSDEVMPYAITVQPHPLAPGPWTQ